MVYIMQRGFTLLLFQSITQDNTIIEENKHRSVFYLNDYNRSLNANKIQVLQPHHGKC